VRTLTLDASVVIKWIFPEKTQEAHTAQALQLLEAIEQGVFHIVQPSHWLAETMAVVTQLNINITQETAALLSAMEFPTADDPEVYHTACQLSHRYHHHLFDTLYHAVALHHPKAQLVTADEHYYRKSYREGGIILLADFSIFR
jgi:predicted nucleic acid-binding protein